MVEQLQGKGVYSIFDSEEEASEFHAFTSQNVNGNQLPLESLISDDNDFKIFDGTMNSYTKSMDRLNQLKDETRGMGVFEKA